VFLDTLAKIQPTTYIKIRSTSSEAARNRHDYEKENFAMPGKIPKTITR
jgi:hypothetical protein